jgi:hypothetical protein
MKYNSVVRKRVLLEYVFCTMVRQAYNFTDDRKEEPFMLALLCCE